METFVFDAVIRAVPDQDAAYVVFPGDIRAIFGRGRVSVHALFDGAAYDGSLVNMGVRDEEGRVLYVLGIRKDIRRRIGKGPGDTVRVELWER